MNYFLKYDISVLIEEILQNVSEMQFYRSEHLYLTLLTCLCSMDKISIMITLEYTILLFCE
jgi:hypothetical protein